MKSPRMAKIAGALLFALACTSPLVHGGAEEVVKTADGISYVSGGVGLVSRERLDALAGEFNLKLVFTLESGAYLSAITVVIADASGKPLIRTVTDGPLLLAKLPAGNYNVSTSLGEWRLERKIGIAADKRKVEYFRWASE